MEIKNEKKGTIKRRDFVKKTAMGLGGMAMLGSLPLSASAYVGGTGEIKVGVIGCGGRGTGVKQRGAPDRCRATFSSVSPTRAVCDGVYVMQPRCDPSGSSPR